MLEKFANYKFFLYFKTSSIPLNASNSTVDNMKHEHVHVIKWQIVRVKQNLLNSGA